MKLIIETKEPDKVTKCVKVSTRGMQILLDLFAWMDMLEPFRLTPDAPEMTVGDSGSVSEHFTHEPCPDCNGSGINTDRWGICRNCNGEGMVLSAKPDDRTPSPTPSFR